ncbi:MAG: thioredoxin domain-containing protein [Bacteroidales bacterium]
MSNALIHESSPYLRQHAHNPVDWHPWGDHALKKAQAEDKLMVVSIGYSTCHWCHVMERESFEDPDVARLMNAHFISVKIDREERPDLDHLFMTAVQMMNQQGGWPLNCVALPDGRPIWGGTYFPKIHWMDALRQLHQVYTTNRDEVLRYADGLEEGIRRNALVQNGNGYSTSGPEELHAAVRSWIPLLDPDNGGTRGAPKFPMPAHLRFLLHYGVQCRNRQILQHVELTLDRMSEGGLFDQAGGGFPQNINK